jgi:hypothetical protein
MDHHKQSWNLVGSKPAGWQFLSLECALASTDEWFSLQFFQLFLAERSSQQSRNLSLRGFKTCRGFETYQITRQNRNLSLSGFKTCRGFETHQITWQNRNLSLSGFETCSGFETYQTSWQSRNLSLRGSKTCQMSWQSRNLWAQNPLNDIFLLLECALYSVPGDFSDRWCMMDAAFAYLDEKGVVLKR